MFKPLIWSIVATCALMITVTFLAQSRYQNYLALTNLEMKDSAQACSNYMCVDDVALDDNLVQHSPSSLNPSDTVEFNAAFLNFGLNVRERVILAHAILCAFGFLVILPAGSLLARYFRTTNPGWFTGHWIVQFGLGAPIILGGVSLGLSAVIMGPAPPKHFDDSHKNYGLALLILYIVQCSFGQFIHWIKGRTQWTTRPIYNYIHPIVGLIIVGLGFYEVRLGYLVEWNKVTRRAPPPAIVDILWYIWAFLVPTLYVIGLSLLPRQYKIEAYRRFGSQHQEHQGERRPLLNPPRSILAATRNSNNEDTSAPRAPVTVPEDSIVADA